MRESQMKVIILAGGLPSTLIEEDEKMPKPMVEIGGRPLLWHIMKQYAHYGYNDFVICTGYKGEVIKDYFMNFYIYQSDITVNLRTNEVQIHRKQTEDWKVSVIDTGLNSSILERLRMVKDYAKDEPVLVAYGDCLSDIDIKKMVELHRMSDYLATFAVAHPTGRNETLSIDEKGQFQGTNRSDRAGEAWVNACSMVLEPEVFRYLTPEVGDNASTLMNCLAQKKPVQTYQHEGFWTPVETIRDKTLMEMLWAQKTAPWKVWAD